MNSAERPEDKVKNKIDLQKEVGLPQREDVPVVGMVSRLVSHKGLDLVEAVLEEFVANNDVQVVVLGSGDWQYENYFKDLAGRYPDKVGARIGFIPALSRKIYAGSDIFLMPSKSEPCGLSQMIALRYGSIPIVRETGGLKDSITDSGDGMGNGFTFSNYNAHDMLHTMYRALEGYRNTEGWKILVKRALECDFSWGRSANEYINKIRLEKAIQLIVNTNMPFTEIAEKVGFATSSYFSTAFKQYTGETPTQYKKRIRQKPAENEQAGRDRTPTDDAPRPLS